MSDYNLQDDVEKKFPEIWKKFTLGRNLTPQEKPLAVMLGGQLGIFVK